MSHKNYVTEKLRAFFSGASLNDILKTPALHSSYISSSVKVRKFSYYPQ